MNLQQFAAGTKGTFCQVCNVALSGPEPARQHYSSVKHQRRAAMGQPVITNSTGYGNHPDTPRVSAINVIQNHQNEQIPAQQTFPEKQLNRQAKISNASNDERWITTDCGYPGCYYHCTVCEKHISGVDNKSQHLAGKDHAKMLQRKGLGLPQVSSQPAISSSGDQAYPAPGTSVSALDRVLTAPNLLSALHAPEVAAKPEPVSAINVPDPGILEHSRQQYPNVSSHPSEAFPEQEYMFDSFAGRGICYICNNLQFTSNEHARQHLAGNNHRKKKTRWEAMKGQSQAVSGLPTSVATFGTAEGQTSSEIRNTPSQPLPNVNNLFAGLSVSNPSCQEVNSPGMALNRLLPQATGVPLSDGIDKTIWHECPVCHKRLNSPDQLRSHMMSHPGYAPSHGAGTNHFHADFGFGKASNLDGIDIVPKNQNINGQLRYGINEISAANLTLKPDVQELMAKTLGRSMVTAFPSMPSSLFSTGEPIQENYMPAVSSSGCTTFDTPSNSTDNNASYGLPTNGDEPIRNPEEVITTGECTFPGCYFHCTICEQHISGSENRVQHLRGRPHEKNLKKRALVTTTTDADMSGIVGVHMVQGFDRFCNVCQVPFNEDSHEAHMKGKKHLGNAAKSQGVPLRSLPQVCKEVNSEKCSDIVYHLTKTAPRSYQIELFEKAMTRDTVIFLPTGTGKTLISCMVMSFMLKINQRRPVVFLVDKVLLVIQQSNVIKYELGEAEFERFDETSGCMEKRPLRIAAICGDKSDTKGLPLWEQDVIVVTADFYKNLLETNILRWSDSCLVVFDESHHCTKTHPFNVLLQNYHTRLPKLERPKVLGLTASPAGQETVMKTKEMLYKLLRNLGDGQLAMVEEHIKELLKHQSCTKLIPKQVGHSAQEKDLRDALQLYVIDCYLRLETMSNLRQLQVSSMLPGMQATKQNLCADIVDELVMALNQIKPRIAGQHLPVEVLKIHLAILCEALRSIDEIGLGGAFATLQILIENNVTGNFAQAKELELKCTALERMVIEFCRKRKQNLDSHLTDMCNDPDLMPAVKQLIHEILEDVNWNTPVKPITLVLVQKRQDAHTLAKILLETPQLQNRGILTVCLVGHGAGGGDGGMAVNKQERIIAEIKSGKYQVVVATSVAEEGVDMPACELVVQMDPPNNVRALVQLRGRARKKNSTFVALCRNQEQKTAIEDLLMREENMKTAVELIVKEQTSNEWAYNPMDLSLGPVLGHNDSRNRDTLM